MGPLVAGVEEGRVPMALVDRAVRRVLEMKFRLGSVRKFLRERGSRRSGGALASQSRSGFARRPRRHRFAEKRE